MKYNQVLPFHYYDPATDVFYKRTIIWKMRYGEKDQWIPIRSSQVPTRVLNRWLHSCNLPVHKQQPSQSRFLMKNDPRLDNRWISILYKNEVYAYQILNRSGLRERWMAQRGLDRPLQEVNINNIPPVVVILARANLKREGFDPNEIQPSSQ